VNTVGEFVDVVFCGNVATGDVCCLNEKFTADGSVAFASEANAAPLLVPLNENCVVCAVDSDEVFVFAVIVSD